MDLKLVIQVINFETKTFEVSGIFDSIEKAMICADKRSNVFIADMVLNEEAPIEQAEFNGIWHNLLPADK